MNKNKLESLEVLKDACNKVTDAINAIEAFADVHNVEVEFQKGDGKVTIVELTDMVVGEIGISRRKNLTAVMVNFTSEIGAVSARRDTNTWRERKRTLSLLLMISLLRPYWRMEKS